MKQYYLITIEEIGEIIDITEDIVMQLSESEQGSEIPHIVELSRKRIDLVNLIKSRPYTVHEKEPIIYEMDDVRFVADEPPDYEDCPCWMPPLDPEGTTGTCEGDGGDCKLWYWNCDGRSYTQCNRFSKDCSKCLEVLCKYRKV